MLKITRAPNLIHSDLCYLELDGRQVGTVYAFAGCYDRIREALEEREATPEEGYLLEEQGREIATLARRVEKAEAVKESLTSALLKISGFSAFWKGFRGNEAAWENVWDLATDALISLRTAEESSVVGLIDSTPAKQQEDSANTGGDGDSVIDEEVTE